MAGGSNSCYELLILQGGRWEFHARFALSEKAQAITEAKNLDKLNHVSAVKVIKDSYDPETGTSSEITVYKSSKGKAEATVSKGRGAVMSSDPGARGPRGVVLSGGGGRGGYVGGGGGGVDRMLSRFDEAPDSRPKRKSWGLFTKLTVIVGSSFLIAAILAGITTFVVTRMPSVARNMGPEDQGVAILGVFVVGFLLSGVILAFSMINHEDLASKPKEVGRGNLTPTELPPPIDQSLSLEDDGTLDDSLGAASKSLADFKAKLLGTEVPEASPASAEPGATPAPAAAAAPPEAAPSPTPAPVAEPLSPFVEAQKTTVMTFLGQTVAAIKAKAMKLDNYNKFGLTLFLAGACEALGTDRALNKKAVSQILTEIVATLGQPREQAMAFAERYDSYLLADARYMAMFQAGRQSMNDQLSNAPGAAAKVIEALAEWSAPKPKEVAVKGTLTVLFTDMVGSTSLTQTLGDDGAQQVVRTHNRIVRNALATYNGKEIKHTGDGIMASFSATTNAVEACIAIQRQIQSHNAVTPELPLHVRIGINAGEPIREENDLFGSMVQMAARVCAKADTDQIFVSEVVRALCSGKEMLFESRGDFELKGFNQPVPLFEVIWNRPLPAPSVQAGLDTVAAAPAPAMQPAAPRMAAPRPPGPPTAPGAVAARAPVAAPRPALAAKA